MFNNNSVYKIKPDTDTSGRHRYLKKVAVISVKRMEAGALSENR
jgi:hypothetical protein